MTDTATEFEKATSSVLSDDDIERDRLRIGIELASRTEEYFSEVTPENARNFAASYGDDNPLFASPDYGTQTRWGGQISAPIHSAVLNAPLRGDPMDPDLRAKTRGVYRGIHSFVSGGTWEFFRPLRPGDRVFSFEGLDSVEVKPSQFADRAVYRVTRLVKFNQRAEILGVYRILAIYAERKTARDKGKYAKTEPASYTDDDIARFDALWEAERPRGAEPRHWEDVEVGDALPDMLKGPLTTTDMIVFHCGGYGHAPYGLKTSRLNYRNRQRIPAFYVKNAQGVPDVAQRVHWDSEWAQAIGSPMAYDYGVLRECWLHHYLCDWVGDDGWIERQEAQLRKFNYHGDVTLFGGRVAAKRIEDGRHLVELEIRADNQRDEETVTASATVALPSRDGGPSPLPEVPAELRQKAERVLARHHELSR